MEDVKLPIRAFFKKRRILEIQLEKSDTFMPEETPQVGIFFVFFCVPFLKLKKIKFFVKSERRKWLFFS